MVYIAVAKKKVSFLNLFCCCPLNLKVWNCIMQVMTPNPECGTVDTPIVDALHTMHDGRFLHLPVVDRGIYICTENLY